MADHFTGMSVREIRGMPLCIEATLLQLGINRKRGVEIAQAQEDYVRSVYIRCPRWRRRKKAKLRQALDYAETVSQMVSTYSEPTDRD